MVGNALSLVCGPDRGAEGRCGPRRASAPVEWWPGPVTRVVIGKQFVTTVRRGTYNKRQDERFAAEIAKALGEVWTHGIRAALVSAHIFVAEQTRSDRVLRGLELEVGPRIPGDQPGYAAGRYEWEPGRIACDPRYHCVARDGIS